MSSASLLRTNLQIPSPTSRIRTHSPVPLPHFRSNLKLLRKSQQHFYTCSSSFPEFHALRASSVDDFDPSATRQSLVDEARAAVFDWVRELGVAESDANEIALKSPRFLKMVVDGVSELDELALWGDWVGGNDESMSFREKVGRMMKEKGDDGKVAFLESVGLSLSSAMNVSRYLSSETLPNLILKVKSMKEIFAPDRDDDHVIGRNARRMMTCLSIPVDDDIQQVLSFFEKIAAKRGGLDMLGSKDASFRHLIESFPRLLLLSVKSDIKPMAKYLESIGVPEGCLRNVLLVYPPIIFYNIKMDISPRLSSIRKLGVDKDFGKMLVKYPWIMSRSIQENYENILYLFETYRVPKESVDQAIKSWPHLLGCSTVKLKAVVECFIELGVNNKKLSQVIASCPQLLLRKPQDISKVVLFFEELGLDKESVGKILGRCPEIFAAKIDQTLTKKLDFLKSFGLSKHLLPRVIKKYPEIFISDIDKTIIPRMKYLTTSGLSKREVAVIVHRFSPILGYSINQVLKPKLEFLTTIMEKPVSDIVEYPRYFSYSLDKKIKPRFHVLKGRKIECSLKDMLAKNDEEFAEEFMGIGRVLIPPALPPSS